MKSVLRGIIIDTFSLFLLTRVVAGVELRGGLATFLVSGFIFYMLMKFIRPVLNLFSLPLNVLTFGLFAFVVNAFIFYLLTVFVPLIEVHAFTFHGFTIAGFVIPRIDFNTFFAYIVASIVFSSIISLIHWLIDR